MKALKTALLNFCFFLALIALVEIFFAGLNTLESLKGGSPLPESTETLERVQEDLQNEDLSSTWLFPPGHHRFSHYDFTIDSQHRRTVEEKMRVQTSSSKKDVALVFLGCSITFGVGVEDTETIPYQTSLSFKNAVSYNYGIPGGGPNQLLYEFQKHPEFFDDINQKKVIGIYLFFYDHINRTALNFSHMMWSPPNLPAYTLTHGRLTGGRGLIHEDPLKYFTYFLLKKSQTARFFLTRRAPGNRRQNAFYFFDDKDLKLTAAVIDRMREKFSERFPGSPFFIYRLTPESWMEEDFFQHIHAPVLRRSVKVERMSTLADGHYTAATNKLLGEDIAQQIREWIRSHP